MWWGCPASCRSKQALRCFATGRARRVRFVFNFNPNERIGELSEKEPEYRDAVITALGGGGH